MRIQSDLCHIDDHRAVVKVFAWNEEQPLGSALGEGKTAEIAEERAINRLFSRTKQKLNQQEYNQNKTYKTTNNKEGTKNKEEVLSTNENTTQLKNSDSKIGVEVNNPNNEPEDWSNILSLIDIEIKRIGWNRDQENQFIIRILNSKDRSRITKYKDISRLLDLLTHISPGTKPDLAIVKSKKEILIEHSNEILAQLNWDQDKGRDYLNEKMNVISRFELTEEQLSEFNGLLEEALNKYVRK